jgi:hypothetical protein
MRVQASLPPPAISGRMLRFGQWHEVVGLMILAAAADEHQEAPAGCNDIEDAIF